MGHKIVHKNPYEMFEKFALKYFKDGQIVLEVGPDSKFYLKSIIQDKADVIYKTGGLASNNKEYDVCFDDDDQSIVVFEKFDVIVAMNVIEHVRRPWAWVYDLATQLKEGGILIIICPVSWGYHKSPYDCWRIYYDGLKSLFKDAGLKTILAKTINNKLTIDSIGIARKEQDD